MDVLTQIAEHHAALAELYRQLAAQADERDPSDRVGDRVVGLREAAHRLGVTVSWLSRRSNWRRVGGRKDLDGRVKFTETRLRAHLEAAATAATNGNR